jgi:Bacteriocin-protection, YdeI or OmpD-Associated
VHHLWRGVVSWRKGTTRVLSERGFRQDRSDGTIRRMFDGLSFTHRREYVEWTEEAKRAETRRRRVERAVDMLRDGRRHP